MENKEQAIIAAKCLLKIESILVKCGLINVTTTFKYNGEKREYIAREEVRRAIRMLHESYNQEDRSVESNGNVRSQRKVEV